MEVFAVTIFMSLAFAVLFAVLFLGERARRKHHSLEQDALLPLDDTPPARRGTGSDFFTQRHDQYHHRKDHDRVR